MLISKTLRACFVTKNYVSRKYYTTNFYEEIGWDNNQKIISKEFQNN